MDTAGSSQGEIVAALRRETTFRSRRRPWVTPTHLLQLIGTVLVGAAIVIDTTAASVVLGGAGAVAIVSALRRGPVTAGPDLTEHVDLGTGLALTSALPTVLRDAQTMASLTGRVAVLVLDVHGATAQVRRGETRAARAVMSAVVHRLEAHSWSYPIGGSFSPLFFFEDPATIVVVRRDVLGDQSNEWLTERLRAELDRPVTWTSGALQPDVTIGGAVGPGTDAHALMSLAGLARRDACAAGAGTVTIRRFDRDRRRSAGPVEVAGTDGYPVGLLFEPPDLGPSVGIFEQLAEVRSAFARALEAVAASGIRPLIGVSVTALSHPAAADELIDRAVAAGFDQRVGIVLAPDFPTAASHRASINVRRLHDAGFLVLVDRRRPADRVRALPEAPCDLVLVDDEVQIAAPHSPADRSLVVQAQGRHLSFAHARSTPADRRRGPLPPAGLDGAPVETVRGAKRPVQRAFLPIPL